MIEINIISALSDNYIYLLRNIEKNITAVVDPGESKPVEKFLNEKGWHLDEIVNTHHHHDHDHSIHQDGGLKVGMRVIR